MISANDVSCSCCLLPHLSAVIKTAQTALQSLARTSSSTLQVLMIMHAGIKSDGAVSAETGEQQMGSSIGLQFPYNP